MIKIIILNKKLLLNLYQMAENVQLWQICQTIERKKYRNKKYFRCAAGKIHDHENEFVCQINCDKFFSEKQNTDGTNKH